MVATMPAGIEVCPAGSCLEPLRSNKNQHFGPINYSLNRPRAC